MSYPGNPSLAEEVRQKVVTTYRQTLDLAEAGKRQEALIGCDFIHRLDPEFRLVEDLRKRLQQPGESAAVDDLRSGFEQLVGPVEKTPETGVLKAPLDDEIDSAFESMTFDTTATGEHERSAVDSPPSAPPDPTEHLSPPPSDDIETQKVELESVPTQAPHEPASAFEPSAELDQESAHRVEELLGEGQAAFEKAQYQSAIDAWSRIFLIDIDHPEANRRIDLARKLKAEVERKIDEIYHDGLAAVDSGERELAEQKFRKVLEMQPSHLAAQEQLDHLEEDDKKRVSGDELPEIEPPAIEGGQTARVSDKAIERGPEPGPAGDPALEPPVRRQGPKSVPARRSPRRSVPIVAALGVALVLTIAWFLYSNWDRFFPNAEEVVEPQTTTPKIDPIVRAQRLHVDGDTAIAISQLRRLPPAHPQYAEAQALIAQWETVLADEQQIGPTPEQIADRDALVASARQAFARREFLAAENALTRAAQIAPLDETGEKLQEETAEQLEPLRAEIKIFRQGEWSYALRNLWRIHEENPSNQDVIRLMVDSYYNLGVRELQRGDPQSALEHLREAAALAGGDPHILRLVDFTQTYSGRSPDLLYRIFVKYLPFRS